MQSWFAPPIAFMVYLCLCAGLVWFGQKLAQSKAQPADSSLYASGESSAGEAEEARLVPGYRPFFQVALFFAVLHLGVLVLATSAGSPMTLIYLLGLVLALIALMLG